MGKGHLCWDDVQTKKHRSPLSPWTLPFCWASHIFFSQTHFIFMPFSCHVPFFMAQLLVVHLVGAFNPLWKNISQLGWLFPIYGKNKKMVTKPPTSPGCSWWNPPRFWDATSLEVSPGARKLHAVLIQCVPPQADPREDEIPMMRAPWCWSYWPTKLSDFFGVSMLVNIPAPWFAYGYVYTYEYIYICISSHTWTIVLIWKR